MVGQTPESRVEAPWHLLISPFRSKPVEVDGEDAAIFARPLRPFLLPNVTSEARDHCANERTFLSWLRLAVYMAVVSSAIVVSFHLKSRPSPLELRASLPVGVIFWLLSLACLVMGVANYVRTVRQYARRRAIVQTGWGTTLVFSVVAVAIVAACVLFLVIDVNRI